MGILSGLLFLPVTGPMRGLHWLLERLHEEADAALRDEGRAFAELIDLGMRHGAGQITDAEYAAEEAALLERLDSIREYRRELLHADDETDGESGEESGGEFDDEPLDAVVSS